MMVSVEAVLLPLLSDAGVVAEQVIGVVPAQLRSTLPLKPLTEARLMVSVPVFAPALTLTGTMVVSGTSVKSDCGFASGPLLLRLNSDGA